MLGKAGSHQTAVRSQIIGDEFRYSRAIPKQFLAFDIMQRPIVEGF